VGAPACSSRHDKKRCEQVNRDAHEVIGHRALLPVEVWKHPLGIVHDGLDSLRNRKTVACLGLSTASLLAISFTMSLRGSLMV